MNKQKINTAKNSELNADVTQTANNVLKTEDLDSESADSDQAFFVKFYLFNLQENEHNVKEQTEVKKVENSEDGEDLSSLSNESGTFLLNFRTCGHTAQRLFACSVRKSAQSSKQMEMHFQRRCFTHQREGVRF